MAFPQDALAPKVELQLNSVWTDITDYVYVRDPITIRRGRRDEGSRPDVATCSMTLDNRDGRFSPRNPSGAYYGTIGRNTPLRVSALVGTPRMVCPTYDISRASTPDSAGLSLTGDFDVRVEAAFTSWADAAEECYLANKQSSWAFLLTSSGVPRLRVTADGVNFTNIDATAALPHMCGRAALRATFDANNGAGGKTVTFYVAASIDGPWQQHGDPVVSSGAITLFDSANPLRVGFGVGEYFKAELRSAISGPVVASPDFTAQAEGATSFADAQGNTWTLNSTGAEITARRYRFYGEVSEWPVEWDLSGRDVYTQVTASGIRRRLAQGDAPLKSAGRRVIEQLPSMVSYWPCEDESGSSNLAAAVGTTTLGYTAEVTLANYSNFPFSDAVPTLNGGFLGAFVPTYTSTGTLQFRAFINLASGSAAASDVLSINLSGGTLSKAALRLGADANQLRVILTNAAGTVVHDSGAFVFNTAGEITRYSLLLKQNGSAVDYKFETYSTGESVALFASGSVASQTLGVATVAYVGYTPAGGTALSTSSVGHVTLQTAETDLFDTIYVLEGYTGDVADYRIARLCDEQDVPFQYMGQVFATELVGVQRPLSFLQLLDEAAATDMGLLTDARTSLALQYRPNQSMRTLYPALTIPYGDLEGLSPTDDDQQTRNDITVSRIGGSSARATQTTGALSVSAPPNGVGRYEDAPSLSLASDSQLVEQASWRLHLGTVDEPRYPIVRVNLASGLTDAQRVRALDVIEGDCVVVEDPPAWLPQGDIRGIVQSITETLEPYGYTIDYNLAPASPYDVGVYGYSVSRYDADSTLNGAQTSSSTSWSVATASGPVWTTTDVPFDIEVGGEQVTVTAVSGASSPQTFTVTRSVNGVVKSHSSGAAVSLWQPAYYSL